jgi:adenosylhomocysteine nucleosidase
VGGREYFCGHWQGVEVVAVHSRIGKVSSAAAAVVLLDRFEVDRIFFIGLAGAVHPDLRVGDVVIATELIQHDMDASALPRFEKYEIPLLETKRFVSPDDWVKSAAAEAERYLAGEFFEEIDESLRHEFHLHRPKLRTGLIASGDQFISDAGVVAALRRNLPDLIAIEMEGAAVAQVCYEFDRPLLVVRAISDSADHAAAVDFPKFLQAVATPITVGIAARVVKALRG